MQIPYCEASGEIFFMYSKGSLNSSSVGLYVGASSNPCGRIFLLVSRLAVGCPLLSTLVSSSGADFMALSGCGAAAGLFALLMPFTAGLPRMVGVLLFVPLAGEALAVELDGAVVVEVGTCTMLEMVEGSEGGIEFEFVRSHVLEN